MEQSEKNFNTQPMGLGEDKVKKTKRKPSISEIKEKLGLDKIPVTHKPIPIKRDGKHLYRVAGFNYPLRPKTIERLYIPSQRIIDEVDREKWLQEMTKVWGKEDKTIDPELYPFGYEE